MIDQHWQQYLNRQVTIEQLSNDGIVALNKPTGILSHPNIERQASKNAILTCQYSLKNETYYTSQGPAAYLLNRLDSPVSGIILIGLSTNIAQVIKQSFREKIPNKKYIALLKGHPPSKNGIWKSKITKIKENNIVRAASCGNNIAITQYTVLNSFLWQTFSLSLVELQPITGRTHQLRIHCAQNRTPIIGDKVYGDFIFNKKFARETKQNQLLLHSNEILLQYKLNKQEKVFHAKSSYNFKKTCINLLRL